MAGERIAGGGVGRFRVQHVQRRARDRAGVERREQRRRVDQPAARGVHDHGGGLARGQRLLAEQAAGVLVEGGVQGDHVADREQLGQLDPLDRPRRAAVEDVCPDDPRPERRRPGGHGLPDRPAADHPEGQLGQPAQGARVLVLPAACPHRAVVDRDPAQQRQRQREGVVGDLVGAVVRDVGHPDAAAGGRLDVDVVHADAVADHQLDGGQRVEHLGGDRRVLVDQHPRPGAPGDHVGRAVALLAAVPDPRRVEHGLLGVEGGVIAVGDHDGRAGHACADHFGEPPIRCGASASKSNVSPCPGRSGATATPSTICSGSAR